MLARAPLVLLKTDDNILLCNDCHGIGVDVIRRVPPRKSEDS